MLRFSLPSLLLHPAWVLLFPAALFSQTISYQTLSGLSVCGASAVEITVQNTAASPLNNVLLTVHFTTSGGAYCGVAYLPGTVSGAAESNISDPGAPVFQLANLAAGQTATVTLDATATCPTAACIDDGQFFVNEITLAWNGGSTALTTDPYIIARPLLVITAVSGTVLSGERGDVLTRTFTIANTRPGPLESFVFTDVYQPGIEVSGSPGTAVSPAANTLQLLLDGSVFTNIGNGDALFEQGESITITEQILVTDCGTSLGSSISNITAGWDCDGTAGPGEACQQAAATAVVQFEAFDKVPNLVFTPLPTLPECYCGPGYRQGLRIENTGTAFAENIVVDLSTVVPPNMGFSWPSFLDSTSVGVDSAGFASQNFSVEVTGSDTTTACDFFPLKTDSLLVTLPLLGPGESLTVEWDVFFCSEGGCKLPEVHWKYRYQYGRECYPGVFAKQETYLNVLEKGQALSSSLASNAATEETYHDDTNYTFNYQLSYDSLHLIEDLLQLNFQVPCGFVWNYGNELLLGGQAPVAAVYTADESGLFITASYQLPLPAPVANLGFEALFECDSICNLSCFTYIESSCPWYLPGPDSTGAISGISVSATFFKCSDLPAGCNLCTTTAEIYDTDCGPYPTCPVPSPGHLEYAFSAARKNFGLPDNNDDHLPEPGGQLDFTQVRTDRLMTGDTLHTEFRAKLLVDLPGAEFPIAFANVFFNQPLVEFLGPANQTGLFSEVGIPAIGASARVFDSSAGLWYDCPQVSFAVQPNSGGRLGYRFELAVDTLAGCGLPANFLFAEGDSIHLDADFRIGYNIQRDGAPDTDPLSAPILVEPIFAVEIAPDSLTVHCYGGAPAIVEITGYEYSFANGNLALPLCQTSNFVGGTQLRVLLNEGGFFPFEYRPVALADLLKVTLPPGISPVETRLTLLRYQDEFSNIVGPVILTPTIAGGSFQFDLGPFQNAALDEGYQALIQYRFDTDCSLKDLQTLEVCATFDFAEGLPEPIDPLNFTESFDVLNPLDPTLSLTTPLANLVFLSDQVSIDFELKNTETAIGALGSGPAPNSWIYVNAPALTDLQIFNVTTGSFLPSANGIFQVGSLPVGTTDLQFLATNHSCETVTLDLLYGWNCGPFTSILQASCDTQMLTLTLLSPPGELDFFVESPASCGDLCDTVGHHSIEIFNAEQGAVYGLTLTAQMPPGFNVLAGSTEVEWPTGSGNFFAIGDPVDLGGGVFFWDVAALFLQLADGLPSVTTAPQNSLTISFLGETTCDFIAGAFGLFTIAGEQNCGLAANTVAKPGDPICINGISQPYSTAIGAEAQPGFGCNDDTAFSITLTASQTLPLGACVIVTLPPGVGYVAGSCSSDCQPNFNCQPTVDGPTLTWQLPAGIAPGDEICFEFSTQNWAALDCGTGTILVRTANETQALCALTGDVCSAKVNTGSLLLPYEVERPDFSLENFTITASSSGTNDVVSYSVEVANDGLENDPPLLLDFLLDTDGDGTGDLLAASESFNISIPAGGVETLTGSFTLPTGNLCNLLAVLASGQCLCAPDSLPVGLPILVETGVSETLCSGDDLAIGVSAQPGFSYQWQPAVCVSPANASTAIFNCENTGTGPDNYAFTLIATDGFCELNYLLDVTVQPVPGIVFADAAICAGEVANILASAGASYAWSGPGVVQNVQNQMVTPLMTSDYAVTVMDAAGCTGTDTTTVLVTPAPSANAGVDTTFCPGTVAQLNAVFQPNLNYEWSPGPPVLSSGSSPNPQVLVFENQVFTLTATDPATGCTGTDEVAVTFGDLLQITLPADLTICEGSDVELTASGGSTYVWSPAGDCQDPACATVLVAPAQTTTYTVNGADAAGCEGSGSVTVTVVDDAITTTGDPIDLCDGETVILFGEAVNQTGEYCGTVQLASGCDSTHCVQVTVAPPIPPTEIDTSICRGDSVVVQGEVFNETGVFPLVYQSASGCDSLVALDLTVLDTPLVALVDSNLPDGFIHLSVVLPVYDSILWFGGNLTGDCTNEVTCEDLLIGDPTYFVMVYGQNGCPGIGTVQPLVLPPCEPEDAEVPNVFTPNGDGVNDEFTLVSTGEEVVLRMRIWNRWGQKVYDGPGPWLGYQDGKPTEPDVYVYLIDIGCPEEVTTEEVQRVKGDVTLLR